MHTFLGKDRDAIKNQRFSKMELWNAWRSESVSTREEKVCIKRNHFLSPFFEGVAVLLQSSERNPQTNTFKLSNTDEEEE